MASFVLPPFSLSSRELFGAQHHVSRLLLVDSRPFCFFISLNFPRFFLFEICSIAVFSLSSYLILSYLIFFLYFRFFLLVPRLSEVLHVLYYTLVLTNHIALILQNDLSRFHLIYRCTRILKVFHCFDFLEQFRMAVSILRRFVSYLM